jgi:carboxylesterase type B
MQSEQAVLPGTGLASYQATLRKFGCNEADSPIQCLRQVSAADIKSWIETNDIFFAPTNDHVTFTTDVRPNIRNKQFADVPFFMGTNADEGRVFAAAFGFDNSSATIEEVVSIIFPNNPDIQKAVAAFYAPFFTDAFLFGSAVLTDLGFLCTTSSLSNYAISNGYSSVWRYLYSAVFPNLSVFPNAGSFHTSEIPQVWGTYPLEGVTSEQEQLSQYMQTTWANFAKNPAAGPGWDRLGSTFSNTLAEVGGSKAPTGKSMISPSSVDYVCALYNPIISVIGL